ncbi:MULTISPECIES: Z-ring formation inhibitor MciZ [Paenibacillus]|uniref:Z-ring formation inhibitor MciZ n=1 Tax=Paenibacillus TaxID=44249 RepID=UPI0022B92EC0|nr:Z-ring formation inhibitor MciZ [Paenibacillus caseinilyticus]MCZ8520616.1 Z-ring formation inhibitor MciZ [Paenibacillus caseinilyticus]
MKSYVTEQQLRLVGKAWEIRKYLQRALERAAADVPLASILDGTQSFSVPQGKRVIRSAAAVSGTVRRPSYTRQSPITKAISAYSPLN